MKCVRARASTAEVASHPNSVVQDLTLTQDRRLVTVPANMGLQVPIAAEEVCKPLQESTDRRSQGMVTMEDHPQLSVTLDARYHSLEP